MDIYCNNLMNMIETVVCFFIKLGRHVNHDEKIKFGGQRSRSQLTCRNKLVNTIET